MRLSKEAIKEFKEIYNEEFGERISDKQAQEMGANLLSLFTIIYRPISKTDQSNDANESNKDP